MNLIDIVDFNTARTDELVRMWRESFEFGVGVIDPHPIEDQRDHFVSAVVPNDAVRIALLDDKLVGFIAATKASITHLYVRVGHHHCGIGSQLLSWAKTQSGGKLWLFAFACNAVARAFYERNGLKSSLAFRADLATGRLQVRMGRARRARMKASPCAGRAC